jgi:hypothetical protein
VSSKENDVHAINKRARVARLLYLLLIPLSTFGMLYVRYNRLVPGDAAATARNILAIAAAAQYRERAAYPGR